MDHNVADRMERRRSKNRFRLRGRHRNEGGMDMTKLRSLFAVVMVTAVAAIGFASPAHATFPNQNGLIAFAFGPEDTAQIYTVKPDGSGLKQITHVDGTAVFPN